MNENSATQDYKRAVENYAKESNTNIFPNSGKEHAVIVLTNMLKNTKNEICILADKLDNNVNGEADYLKALDDCINKKVLFKIILNSKPDPGVSKAFDSLTKYQGLDTDKVVIKYLIENGKVEFNKEFTKDCHFSIFDGNMFRLEYDPINYKAKCSFNNERVSQILKTKFEKVFDAC